MQARTREQWAALVAAFERTGQSTARFCATRRINPKTFAWWRWQLRSGARASSDGLKLLSVDVVDRRDDEHLVRGRLPRPVAQRVRELSTGAFVERADNVLAFGLPGVAKTHVACALGDALVRAGRSVFFVPTYQLVQQLLAARRDLSLPRALRHLDAFDVVILDDLGYVQQNADEAEVLFTMMAERYERRSLVITSNLVFSQWERIFKNPMATAAAIDRLVHHAVILELDVPSYRTEDAKKRNRKNDDYNAPPPNAG